MKILNPKQINLKIKDISLLKRKIKILANFFFDRIMPYKRLRKFSIDRWMYKNESDRYTKYSYPFNSINIFPEKDFYHPKWDCLVSKNDIRHKYLLRYKEYNFKDIKKFPTKYRQAYSSYFIQTLPEYIAKKILLEVYSSLQIKGIFRIIVPDSDFAYEAYKNKRIDFFEMLSPKNYNYKNEEFYNEIMLATFIAGNDIYSLDKDWKLGLEIKKSFLRRDKDHFLNELINLVNTSKTKKYLNNKNWFNYRKLKMLLLQAGFTSIYRSGYGQSKSPQMRDIPLFDSKFPSLSLYVEAIKEK